MMKINGATCKAPANGGGSGAGTGSGGRNVRKRVMANERERERTKSLNQALETLRRRIPVPEAEKRSKIQTLRTAKEYIEFLGKVKKLSQQNQTSNNNSQTNEDLHLHQQQQSYQTTQQPQPQQQQATSATSSQPDSPLTYKFYKFRLKNQTRGNLGCTKIEVETLCNPIAPVPKVISPDWCDNNAEARHQSAQP